MGEVADSMINGELCSWCGVFLEPGETVYTLKYRKKQDDMVPDKKVKMPKDGKYFGVPVICKDCK